MKMRLWFFLCLCGMVLATGAYADIGASDPSRLGVGARPLGMGRMFIPVADDASAIFMNPAGLTQPRQLQFMTMASQVVWAVDYRVIGFVVPAGSWGAFGLGYAMRDVPDIALVPLSASVNGRVDRTQVSYGSFTDSAMLVSWARPFELFGSKRWSVGSSLKFFRKSGTGSYGMEQANASGTNMDLGVHWNWRDDINLGFTMQNFIHPSDKSGLGVLTWDTGEVEYFDSIMKIGISNRFFDRKVLVGIEYENNNTQPQYPGIGHLGLEWEPIKAFFVRTGINQAFGMPDVDSSRGFDMYNNLTLGLGLIFSGWRIDYAYNVISDVPNLNTHFVSLSLVGDEEAPREEAPVEEAVIAEAEVVVTSDLLIVKTPEDMMITYAATVLVSGEVRNHKTVRINGEDYPVNPNGTFGVMSGLGIGRNDIIVTVQDYPVKVLRRVLRLATFVDVTEPPYKEPIEYLAMLGFVGEDHDGYFNPDRFVTRAEVARMLIKMRNVNLPITMRGIWEDIDIAASQGLIIGFPDGLLRPAEKLTKAQLAMILARFERLPVPERPAMAAGKNYLAQEHWAATAVQALANTGLYRASEFSPLSGPVTRKELVMAFYRTSYCQKKVSNMLNFVDEAVEPSIPQTSQLFMRAGRTTSEQEEQRAFEKIMGGTGAAGTAVNVGAAAPAVDAGDMGDAALYQKLISNRAAVAASSGTAPAPLLSIMKPYDRSVVYTSAVVVQGSAQAGSTVLVNDTPVVLNPNGKFYTVVKFGKYGKHMISIKATNKSGGVIRKTARILYLPDVKDIAASSPYKKTVAGLVALGIVPLDGAGNFNPAQGISRAEWSVSLARAKGLQPVAGNFTDVPAGSPGAGYIGAVVKAGYLPVAKPGVFEPKAPVSRARAGISLALMEGLDTTAFAGKSGFGDVSPAEPYANYIAAAQAAGILPGITLKPTNALTRLSGAIFLSGTSSVKTKLDELNNWNTGF